MALTHSKVWSILLTGAAYTHLFILNQGFKWYVLWFALTNFREVWLSKDSIGKFVSRSSVELHFILLLESTGNYFKSTFVILYLPKAQYRPCVNRCISNKPVAAKKTPNINNARHALVPTSNAGHYQGRRRRTRLTCVQLTWRTLAKMRCTVEVHWGYLKPNKTVIIIWRPP